MTAIESELERIAVELRNSIQPDRYMQLYAAQQALSWAQFPEGFMSPFDAIVNGKVKPPILDIQEGSTDCSVTPYQVRS